MSWLATYRSTALRLLPGAGAIPDSGRTLEQRAALRAVAAQVRVVALAAGCKALQPPRWWRGVSMPPLVVWRALVAAAGLQSRADALLEAWQAETVARRARRAGRVLSEADVRATWALPVAAAARQLGVARATVRAARLRWPS